MSRMEKARFKVVGMYCTTCKPIIENQLKDDKAINRIEIDFMTDSIEVEHDSSEISKEEIKRKLENSGYKFIRLAISM